MDHNFTLVNCDTDSVSFCKPNFEEFTKEEQENLLKELNSLYPETIIWEHDGVYSHFLVVKAKNYVLKEIGGKVKIKGSSLKASGKCPALQQFIKEIINSFLEDRQQDCLEIYHRYVREIFNIQDISRWCSKQTYTDKINDSERTNEVKKLKALENTDYRVGDKFYSYYDMDGNLKLREHWNNDHDKVALLKNLYTTLETFETVLDISQFVKFTLKSYDVQCKLNDVLGLPHPEKVKKTRKKKEVENE